MVSDSPLLTVKNLGRELGDRWLWRGVTFSLRAGDCLGLVAPSGAGKTLLMRNLVGLDPVQQGEVSYGGRRLGEWVLPTYRTQVMYVPQRATPFAGTVEDNLRQVFTLGVYRQRNFDRQRLVDWLYQLGRDTDFLQRQGSQLSGGEAQLLALLRVLQLDPYILLLDEPTASLDNATTAKVEALLDTWLQQPDHACLLTSHDMEQIQRVTQQQLYLGEFTHG
jgi:putative ABC transport system ATP-binding protein